MWEIVGADRGTDHVAGRTKAEALTWVRMPNMRITGQRAARGGWLRSTALLVATVALLSTIAGAHPNHQSINDLAIVPFPLQVQAMRGLVTLTPSSRIVATDPTLLPVAELVRQELARLTPLELAVSQERARPGDIVLRLDERFTTPESYSIVAADRVTVVAGNVRAVTVATATFLQALGVQDGVTAMLKMRISDEPTYPFRGACLRVERADEATFTQLREVIELCRWYRLNVLQVELGEAVLNGVCTTEEAQATWRKLEAFAALRAVELVPAVSVATVDDAGGPDAVIEALAAVFSEAKHIGVTGSEDQVDAAAVARLVAACRAKGRTVLLDEGVGIEPGAVESTDVVIVAQTTADRWLDAGYRVVNASVPPLRLMGEAEAVAHVIHTDWEPWGWMTQQLTDARPRLVAVRERTGIIGAQVELVGPASDPTAHLGVAAVAERLWNPMLRRDFADMCVRFEHTGYGMKLIWGHQKDVDR